MYHVPHFKANENAEVMAFMKAHPFVTICGIDKNNLPVATHIPVLIVERDEKLYLQAHIMRKQDHHIAFESNGNVLVIFQGANAYVSSSWYHNDDRGSTWNYQAVHAKGVLRFLSEKDLYDLLTHLTAHFEKDPDSSSQVKNLPDEYMQSNMKAIIALEIEVTDLQHVFKMSQNRNKQSYHNVIEELEKGDLAARTVAEEMKKNADKISDK
jgi:transcriptional regulator